MNAPRDEVYAELRKILHSDDLTRAIFSGVTRGPLPCSWKKVTIRPVVIRDVKHWQFSYFDGRKTTVVNRVPLDAEPMLTELFDHIFSGIHVATLTEEIDVQQTKKDKIIVGRKRISAPVLNVVHNRAKDHALPEGSSDRVLEVMGILTSGGRVKPTMRAKFTQINEFLKHLDHNLKGSRLLDLDRPIDILDCGCGSSYLTIAAHHYLNTIRKIPARLLGIDVNDEVIRKSTEKAERISTEGLSFSCARIAAESPRADVVFALHACDTATDDALALAVRAQAELILCVPCCHHDLNRQINSGGSMEVLRPILRHGILKERQADLFTDAFRALILRILGYRTDVVEFVSPEHTARNLMIRATKTTGAGNLAAVREYDQMIEFCGVIPKLAQLLSRELEQLCIRSHS